MSEKIPSLPPELVRIYGAAVPPNTIEMFGKLKGKAKRESYVAALAAEEAEKKKKMLKAGFTPQEMQNIINETLDRIPEQESVPRTSDVDATNARAPQYAKPKRVAMQADMNKLTADDDTPLQLRKKLRDLVDKVTRPPESGAGAS